MRAPLLLALAAGYCGAQNTAPPLVNLGRLSIARVFSGGRAGGQDAEKFYGVRNAFDGGSNIINGLNYSSWVSGPQDFVIVRFSQPVTVTGMVVEGSRVSYTPSPGSFTIQIRSAGARDLFLSPAIAFEAGRVIYALPGPVGGVREIMLTFQSKSPSGFGVEEIQILGPAPVGVDLTPVTPVLDADLVRGTSKQSQDNTTAQRALIRTLAGSEVAKMRAGRLAVDRAPDAARKALAWLELNRAADQLSGLLGLDKELEPVAKQASALGVTIEWCEPGAHWFGLGEGYEQYLQILPTGPQADDAWWMRRFRDCGDFEGSAEEYEEAIQWLTDFLKRFPNSSSHGPDARQQLHDVQEQYDAIRAPAKK
jgi:hypothetical protein